MLFNRG